MANRRNRVCTNYSRKQQRKGRCCDCRYYADYISLAARGIASQARCGQFDTPVDGAVMRTCCRPGITHTIDENHGTVKSIEGCVEVAWKDGRWVTVRAIIERGCVATWREDADEAVRKFAGTPAAHEAVQGCISALLKVIVTKPWVNIK